LFLVAGGLSLGEALQSTGILEHYAAQMRTMNVGSIAFIFILAYAAMIFSNVMSNAAAATVLIPLGFAILPGLQKEVALSVGLAASVAILLPVSTPTNAIVFSTGYLGTKRL
jgi:sodium-dependent dicarboxylate transporter 2/3/5